MFQCGEERVILEMDRHGSPVLDFVEVKHPPEEAAGHKEQRDIWEMSY